MFSALVQVLQGSRTLRTLEPINRGMETKRERERDCEWLMYSCNFGD